MYANGYYLSVICKAKLSEMLVSSRLVQQAVYRPVRKYYKYFVFLAEC